MYSCKLRLRLSHLQNCLRHLLSPNTNQNDIFICIGHLHKHLQNWENSLVLLHNTDLYPCKYVVQKVVNIGGKYEESLYACDETRVSTLNLSPGLYSSRTQNGWGEGVQCPTEVPNVH